MLKKKTQRKMVIEVYPMMELSPFISHGFPERRRGLCDHMDSRAPFGKPVDRGPGPHLNLTRDVE